MNGASISIAAGATASPDRIARRRIQELHFALTQATRTTVAVAIVAVFVAPVVTQWVGWLRFAAWAGLTIAAYGARYVLLQPGGRIEAVEANPGRWTALLFGSTLACGAVGASAPLLFFPSLPTTEQMFLTMIFCCWVTGAMASIGAHRTLYVAYTVVFIGQLILAWLLTQDAHAPSIAVLLVAYGVIIAAFAGRFGKQVREGFEIRFQNEELILELDAARTSAEAANLAKSRFLAVASHDLRQPLHALTILSGLLNRQAAPEKTTEIAEQITRSVASLEKLFSSLLDLSRLEVGAVQPDLHPVSVSAVIAQIEGEYLSRAQAKGLEFKVNRCDAAIVTDPTLFERILRNLTDNAIKYTARGRVEIACERRDNALVISVRDTGPGIHAEEREAVFQEFYQSSEARRDRDSGLGLGLAIVKRLSDLLGFSIRVESEVGVGTTFMLTVPERMVSGDSVDAIGDLEEEAPISLDRFAIVYIDDDARVLSAMKLLLGEWGCDVIAGASLEEVRAKIRERGMHPEAILSDYRLAGPTNGVEAIDALREEFGGLPAAVLTGESSPEARDRLRETEYPVLLKPVNPKELRKLLEMFRSIG